MREKERDVLKGEKKKNRILINTIRTLFLLAILLGISCSSMYAEDVLRSSD